MMPRLMMRLAVLSAIVFGSTSLAADPTDLAFRPAEEEGFYTFDTGVLRGKVRLNGRSQGITELVHVPTGTSMASGGRLPGLFSYYRVLATNARYGKAVRDWPTETKILPGGALEVFWPVGEDHPLEITAVCRWSRPDTLDVVTTAKPLDDMPKFEVFISNYYEKPFRGRVYVTPPDDAAAGPRFVPIDQTPDAKGRYVMLRGWSDQPVQSSTRKDCSGILLGRPRIFRACPADKPSRFTPQRVRSRKAGLRSQLRPSA